MKNRKVLLPVLSSIALVISLILTGSMLSTAPVMARGHATLVVAADTTVSVENYLPAECDVGDWMDIIQVAAGSIQTVGLRSDGTVVVVGWGYSVAEGEKQPWEVGGWRSITQVAAGGLYTVGLKSDGTVVAVGYNYDGECNVGGWTNVTQVAVSGGHTVGLRCNGTVLAVGRNEDGQCNVGNWTDIVQVAAGGDTVGLKADGTVVAVGYDEYGQRDVGGWTGITQVAAGEYHTLGLKLDGTVVAAGGYVCCSLPSGGCLIATAAYCTAMAGEIEILRKFRDEYLLTNPVGQALVDFYYRVSPPIAEFITEHPSLKPIVRAGLLPAIAMSTLALSTTPAQKTAIVGLLALISVVLAIWTIRGRSRGPEYTRG